MRTPMDGSEFSRNAERLSSDVGNPYQPELGQMPESNVSPRDLENVNETGTTIVGLVTADGVVMATDKRASLGGRIVSNKDVQKVEEIQPNAALTISGSVGGAQSFIRSLRAEANLYEARRGKYMSIKALSTMASNLLRGGPFFIVVPLLGGVDDDGGHVFSLDPSGSSLSDDYSANGSGMQFAYGVLEQEYTDDLSMEEGVSVAARAVQSAMERDTASGNGIYIAEITRNETTIQGYDDVEELL
ncbi:archaeal proteasome endopeptidase complex subunit beta [Halobacteriaceae archaeon GCM10025711]